jgi:hypothetical protein
VIEQEQSPETPPTPSGSEVVLSRRQFFSVSLIGGSALGTIGLVYTPGVSEELAKKLRDKPVLDRLRDEALVNRRNGISTAIETVIMWAGNMALADVLDRTSIKHGGHAGDGEYYAEQVEKAPMKTYLQNNMVIPVIEEMIFRLLPSAFFRDGKAPDTSLRWNVGLTSAALFSLMHNFSMPKPGKIAIHLDSLPLEQMVLGAYCWYAQRKGGFFHATAAHVAYNNLCMHYPDILGTRDREEK